MTKLEEDIFDILELIRYGWHGRYTLYKNTNEDLNNVLSVTDFSGKEVLSVMASADQVFSEYYLGAKEVDTFDTNRYTKYYFYLKKWCLMKYKSIVIPDDSINVLNALEFHNDTKEERLAYKFWKEVLEECISTKNDFSNNFNLFGKSPEGWTVPYYDDIDKMIDIITWKKANFTNQDLFLPMKTKKKYDIIVLSNILEFMMEKAQYNVIDNLNRLLKKDGIIICSNVIYDKPDERSLFEENGFIYNEGANGIITVRKPCAQKIQPVCYTYKRR